VSTRAQPPVEAGSQPPEEETRGRGRQIVAIFLAIALIAIAIVQFHAVVPGMDQLVGVTPIVLAVVVAATIWLLLRTGRRGG
jgi:hypothetical protein